MTKNQSRTIHIANLLVGGTGAVYAFMIWGMEPLDEFAIVNHAWQPQLQHWHILTAPLLVFAVGWVWQSHIWSRIRSGFRSHRRTGLFLGVLFAPMVMTGYGLQVTEEEAWRAFWGWSHVVSSSLWLLVAIIHPCLPRR